MHSPLRDDNSDRSPVYYRLQKILLNKIESGQWEPGALIPTEREMVKEYGVSTGTVKKAVLNLVQDGFLYRIQGRGTFVAGTTLRPESLRYYRYLSGFNGIEADLTIEFMDLSLVKDIDYVREQLDTKKGECFYKLNRVFMNGEKPLVYCSSFYPQSIFPGFDEIPQTRFEKIPVYLIIEKYYGMPTIHNHELFSSVSADKTVAEILHVSEGTAMLDIDMLSFTYRNRPYEYRKSYCITGEERILRET